MDAFDKNLFYEELLRNGVITSVDPKMMESFLKEADAVWEKRDGENSLKAAKRNFGKGKIYSDRWDGEGRQVIDLVQEGGAMLGIALVGYTYILEKAGLRFMSLAGTSAGGINTMMLAALPDSIYSRDGASKSEILAHVIANAKFERFIDRKGAVSKIVAFALHRVWGKVLKALMFPLYVALAYGTFYLLYSLCVRYVQAWQGHSRVILLYVLGTLSATLPFVGSWFMVKAVLGKFFGLNPGRYFKNWCAAILDSLNAKSTHALKEGALSSISLYSANGSRDESGVRRLVLIASNVTHNRIVKFPERAGDYWETADNVHPAEYVRATMSIPFFFEVYMPNRESEESVIVNARFVDGGMLSNFPIREFHSRTVPRFPTFGIKLGLDEQNAFNENLSLFSYAKSFFGMYKEFYDNEFIASNEETRMLVANIDTGNSNWLNFWMESEEKRKLFRQGAEAACDFLANFNWTEYKRARKETSY